MNGLAKLSDRDFISAMQSLNREIQNPIFFTFFFSAAILLPFCTILQYQKSSTLVFGFLLAATFLYLIGVMGVTIFGNVPLNNVLDSFQLDGATMQEISLQRNQFEKPWVNLNFVRTAAAFFSILFVILACLYDYEKS